MRAALLGALGLFFWDATALAHHSFAAYDRQQTKTVTGTLKEFDWNAPHSGITVVYVDEKGQTQEVSVTTGAPSTIAGQGFKPRDFRVGTKVTLSWHPNRNGLPGGEMSDLKLEDGRVLHGGFGAPPGAEPPGGAPPANGAAPPGGAPPPKGNAPPAGAAPPGTPPASGTAPHLGRRS